MCTLALSIGGGIIAVVAMNLCREMDEAETFQGRHVLGHGGGGGVAVGEVGGGIAVGEIYLFNSKQRRSKKRLCVVQGAVVAVRLIRVPGSRG